MTVFQTISSAVSSPEPYKVVVVMAMAMLVIVLLALFLGKEIRWSQHGYWKRKDAKTKRPQPFALTKPTTPTGQAKGTNP